MSEEAVGAVAEASTTMMGDSVPEGSAPSPNPSTDTSGTWMDGMSEEQVGGIQNKGWKSAADMYTSYSELEAFRGVPADQLIKKPKEGESWDSVYDAIGRPETSKDYVYNAPEGFEGSELLESIREVAFEKGLTAEAFTAITGKYDEVLQLQETAMQEEMATAQNIEIETLKREIGEDDFNRRVHQSDQAAVALGFSQDVADSLRKALGVRGMLDVMNKIHDSIGEDSVNNENGTSPYGDTKEQLKDKKKELMAAMGADPKRLADFNAGIGTDVLEYKRLNNSIYT